MPGPCNSFNHRLLTSVSSMQGRWPSEARTRLRCAYIICLWIIYFVLLEPRNFL
jgi:hypothetical protein